MVPVVVSPMWGNGSSPLINNCFGSSFQNKGNQIRRTISINIKYNMYIFMAIEISIMYIQNGNFINSTKVKTFSEKPE